MVFSNSSLFMSMSKFNLNQLFYFIFFLCFHIVFSNSSLFMLMSNLTKINYFILFSYVFIWFSVIHHYLC
jgi:hypothetical protein